MMQLDVSLLEYDQPAAGRGHLGTEVLQAEPLSSADAVRWARRADQPAVVHSSLEAPVFILSFFVQPLRLL